MYKSAPTELSRTSLRTRAHGGLPCTWGLNVPAADPRSDALLQGCDGERLDDGPRGLGLHNAHLPEDLPLASLGRGLLASLDHADARERNLPSLGDLRGHELREARQHLHALALLELALRGKRIR